MAASVDREIRFVVETISGEKGPEWQQDDCTGQPRRKESVHSLRE